jgi:hypothetical protein
MVKLLKLILSPMSPTTYGGKSDLNTFNLLKNIYFVNYIIIIHFFFLRFIVQEKKKKFVLIFINKTNNFFFFI